MQVRCLSCRVVCGGVRLLELLDQELGAGVKSYRLIIQYIGDVYLRCVESFDSLFG